MIYYIKNMRVLFTLLIGITSALIYSKEVATTNDSVFCFILKHDYQNENLSRSQFVMKCDSICDIHVFQANKVDSILSQLEYIGKSEYNADDFAQEWVFENDSILYIRSLTKPTIALLIRYCLNNPPKKIYTEADIISYIWVTTERVEIDDRCYRLSSELNKLLFGKSK